MVTGPKTAQYGTYLRQAGSVGDSIMQEANRPCIDNVIERSTSYK